MVLTCRYCCAQTHSPILAMGEWVARKYTLYFAQRDHTIYMCPNCTDASKRCHGWHWRQLSVSQIQPYRTAEADISTQRASLVALLGAVDEK
jgi:hypothetical protein